MLRHVRHLSSFASVSFLLFFLCGSLLADQITLKSGDRLSGKVVKSDGKTLVLHTDAAGDVTLKFDAIDQISTDQDLHVGLKDGKTVVGPVTTSDGKLEVASKTARANDPNFIAKLHNKTSTNASITQPFSISSA